MIAIEKSLHRIIVGRFFPVMAIMFT